MGSPALYARQGSAGADWRKGVLSRIEMVARAEEEAALMGGERWQEEEEEEEALPLSQFRVELSQSEGADEAVDPIEGTQQTQLDSSSVLMEADEDQQQEEGEREGLGGAVHTQLEEQSGASDDSGSASDSGSDDGRRRSAPRRLAVRRPLRPFWRPFWLGFTYVTPVLVKE
eukprot:COSAG01_NODE_8364_length_2813_cov_7.535741_2_plen_172_part_00